MKNSHSPSLQGCLDTYILHQRGNYKTESLKLLLEFITSLTIVHFHPLGRSRGSGKSNLQISKDQGNPCRSRSRAVLTGSWKRAIESEWNRAPRQVVLCLWQIFGTHDAQGPNHLLFHWRREGLLKHRGKNLEESQRNLAEVFYFPPYLIPSHGFSPSEDVGDLSYIFFYQILK